MVAIKLLMAAYIDILLPYRVEVLATVCENIYEVYNDTTTIKQGTYVAIYTQYYHFLLFSVVIAISQ